MLRTITGEIMNQHLIRNNRYEFFFSEVINHWVLLCRTDLEATRPLKLKEKRSAENGVKPDNIVLEHDEAAGTLSIADDAQLGDTGAGVTFTGAGTLALTTGITSARAITLGARGTGRTRGGARTAAQRRASATPAGRTRGCAAPASPRTCSRASRTGAAGSRLPGPRSPRTGGAGTGAAGTGATGTGAARGSTGSAPRGTAGSTGVGGALGHGETSGSDGTRGSARELRSEHEGGGPETLAPRPGRDGGAPSRVPHPSFEGSGGDLLSQGAPPQVPSARAVFTSVFGMGTGVSPPLLPPEISCQSSALCTGTAAPRRLHSEHEHREDLKPSAD